MSQSLRWNVVFISNFFALAAFLAFTTGSTYASSTQASTLEIPLPGGTIPKTLTFPVYEQEGIRYFSAGMGKEERSLVYPPYSAKLIFVKGKRAYLAGVSVEITKNDGSALATIPAEEVQGPWLFIDLPKGNYTLKATDSQGMTLKKSLKVHGNSSSTVHFRWP